MKHFLGYCVMALCLVASLPSDTGATTEYARQTGYECGKCHLDPAGGGPLTKQGQNFLAEMRTEGLYRPLSGTRKIVRLCIGYLHLLTAIAWFGAILYVHILLKPAYAAKGLPRGELLLGWGSILIILVTGVLLSVARVPSLKVLYTTRFGILLSIKVGLFLTMVSTALVVTFFIGPRLRRRRFGPEGGDLSNCTADMLAYFDGKEGRPAYFSHKGIIYDATGSRLWREGGHMRKHLAGTDLTGALQTAPHGEEKFLSLPQVGRLRAVSERPTLAPHVRLFYFFAYMNLVCVFLIVFVIALMRWG
jgi:predicted heme/steroid binding protein